MVRLRRQRSSKIPHSGLAAVQASRLPKPIAALELSAAARFSWLSLTLVFRIAPGSFSITASHTEVGLPRICVDQGGYMAGFDCVGDGFFD
jgi:hypothetical protein